MSSSILKYSLRQMTRAGQTSLRPGNFRPLTTFVSSPIRSMSLMKPFRQQLTTIYQPASRMAITDFTKKSLFHSSRNLKNSEKTTTTTQSTSNTSSTSSKSAEHPLTWNEFLALRIKRRKINVYASILTTFAGIMIGWGAVANVEIDPTALIYGFDPIKVLSVVLVVCGGLGYLAGPTLGAAIFRASIRKEFGTFVKKDVEFLHHIKTNRPDPRSQSYTNPVTDYYGEKIGSLKDYRQWLRDGRVYRKKTENFL